MKIIIDLTGSKNGIEEVKFTLLPSYAKNLYHMNINQTTISTVLAKAEESVIDNKLQNKKMPKRIDDKN